MALVEDYSDRRAESGRRRTVLNQETDGSVGIGTDSPAKELHIFKSDADAGVRIESSKTDSAVTLQLKNDARQYTLRLTGVSSDILELIDATASQTRLVVNTSGDIGLGGGAAPTGGGAVFYLDDNGGNPSAMGSGTAGIYNNGGELFAIDSAANATQLTTHSDLAPGAFYLPEDRCPPAICRTVFPLLGVVQWVRLDQKVPASDESFDDYNARLLLSPGDAGFLKPMTKKAWDQKEKASEETARQAHAAWEALPEDERGAAPALYKAKAIPERMKRYMDRDAA